MKKILFLIISLLLRFPPKISAQGMMGNSGFSYGLGWMPMVFFWGLIALSIFAIIKLFTGKINQQSPLEVLKVRYAKGDITKKEFEDTKKSL